MPIKYILEVPHEKKLGGHDFDNASNTEEPA